MSFVEIQEDISTRMRKLETARIALFYVKSDLAVFDFCDPTKNTKFEAKFWCRSERAVADDSAMPNPVDGNSSEKRQRNLLPTVCSVR